VRKASFSEAEISSRRCAGARDISELERVRLSTANNASTLAYANFIDLEIDFFNSRACH
jgi:hypothetical protein